MKCFKSQKMNSHRLWQWQWQCLPLSCRFGGSPSPSPLFLLTCNCNKPKKTFSPQLSFSTPRRSRRPRSSRRPTSTPNSDNSNYPIIPTLRRTIQLEASPDPDNPNLKLVLHFDQISSLSSSTLDHLLSLSRDAFHDLRNLIQFDSQTRAIHLSCRKSTLQFLSALVTCAFLTLFAFRLLFKLSSTIKARFRPKPKVIVRRDRSLGGREVVVGTITNSKRDEYDGQGQGQGLPLPRFRALDNPLSTSTPLADNFNTTYPRLQVHVGVGDNLPKWWPPPDSLPKGASVFNSEYYQTQANRLIRAIIDNRLGGKDISEEDILQLRQICRTSGVRVSIDTMNTRDSFYRASVELVLNVCCRAPSQSTYVQIDGEDARHFLAGLADNIGLDNNRAARMVSAGVAARTRFCFLQAWAFEMQGKHTEALLELSKICTVHRIFPPEEASPEMEMVARGLEKLLKVEQRELLMGMLVGVCSGESHRSAAEALGLVC